MGAAAPEAARERRMPRGICSASGSSYTCGCVNGHSGTHCEVPCDLTDVLITFADLAPAEMDKLEQNGVEVFGSANLVFYDDEIYGQGFGIAGGLGDFVVDGVEFVTFRFSSPVQNASYYVESSTTGTDAIYGDSTIEGFDAANDSLGTRAATDLGQKNVSLLFDDSP